MWSDSESDSDDYDNDDTYGYSDYTEQDLIWIQGFNDLLCPRVWYKFDCLSKF